MESRDIDNLRSRFMRDGMQGLNAQLDSIQCEKTQRLEALDEVRKALASNEKSPPSLDQMHEIYEACVVHALAIADGDEKLMQYANATSYNLSANLASCWFDDRRPRERKHFEAGVAAANRCLALRTQLNKPPFAFAMAYFILGVHEFSLKHYSAAEHAWLNKLEQELLGFENHVIAETDLNVILSRGLISLVRWRLGSGEGKDYEESMSLLEAQRNADNSAEVDLFKSELSLLGQIV